MTYNQRMSKCYQNAEEGGKNRSGKAGNGFPKGTLIGLEQ